jgi:UDP-N-acetylglucosamine 1-carboxyvinyltransferase
MMEKFEIHGGIPLRGELAAAGNKNAALPMIVAALLTDEPVILENVPDIGDVRTMIGIVRSLGVVADWDAEEHRLCLTAEKVNPTDLDLERCQAIRASILAVAPVLYRCGEIRISPPGGDVIGCRRLDAHFEGLQILGAQIGIGSDYTFKLSRGFRGGDIFLPEASVTATEQLLMAAAVARGTTVIRNAACEPHVSDLALMLNAMGASISGIGTNLLKIQGVRSLHGVRHRVLSDHTEAGSYLALAAATGGELTVTGIDPEHYRMTVRVFQRLGIGIELGADRISVSALQDRRIIPDPSGGMPVIADGLWPQFPSDLMSVMLLLATQVQGTVLFFEKLYESRMYFVDRLISMGANAVICDPHRVVVCGASRLRGIELSSPDIRAGISLVGAALCADGCSLISNVQLIDRGYEAVEQRLRSLGARIVRHSDHDDRGC